MMVEKLSSCNFSNMLFEGYLFIYLKIIQKGRMQGLLVPFSNVPKMEATLNCMLLQLLIKMEIYQTPKTYQTPWKRFMSFVNNIQTNPSLLLVELVKRGGDVTNATIGFIHMNVHPRLVINLFLTHNLILVNFKLTSH